MIIRFQDKEQYQQWIKWQSWNVKEKANKFSQKYGDILPIVLVVEVDSCQACDSGSAHVFIHPSQAEELLKWVVE